MKILINNKELNIPFELKMKIINGINILIERSKTNEKTI